MIWCGPPELGGQVLPRYGDKHSPTAQDSG
jgi:hypothetical protein